MKHIAIIGGTGSTGKEVVSLALTAGYQITIVARNPLSIEPRNNLTVVAGDVTNPESLKNAFKDIDAVISCFGPANNIKAGNLMSAGTTNIVRACEANGVPRLVFMSGILQSTGSELGFFNRLGIRFIRLFLKGVYRDKIIAEASIQESSLSWVILRAVGLSKSKPNGRYKAGIAIKVSPFTPLSYTDLALCLIDAVEEHEWSKKIVNVGKA